MRLQRSDERIEGITFGPDCHLFYQAIKILTHRSSYYYRIISYDLLLSVFQKVSLYFQLFLIFFFCFFTFSFSHLYILSGCGIKAKYCLDVRFFWLFWRIVSHRAFLIFPCVVACGTWRRTEH